MRWKEISESIREINFDFDEGDVHGYAVESSTEQLPNWLDRYGFFSEDLVQEIRESYPKIAMLNNLNVDEDYRGNGMGNDLLESFIAEAKSLRCNAILLISDVMESQVEGFDLTKWYESKGFKIKAQAVVGPLMILDL